MNIIPLCIILVLAIYFVRSKPEKQILLLLITIACGDVLTVGGFSFSKCPQLLALIMFIQHHKKIIKSLNWLNSQPYFKLIYIIVLADIILIVTSPHLRSAWAIGSFFIAEILLKYFVIILPLCFIRNFGDIRKLVKPVFYSMVVLSILAALQYTTRELFIDTLLDIQFPGNSLQSDTRPRATSLFISSFDFGYVNLLLMLFLFYARNRRWLRKTKFHISIFLGCTNTLLCGSRTVLFCIIIAVIVYVLIRHNFAKNTCYALAAIMILIVGYAYIPAVQSKVDLLLSSFDMNSKVEGSSMSMRINQYTATLYHIKDNILFGRGYRYFLIDMSWGEDGYASLADSDLKGLEGVLMNYMLERGFFGAGIYIIFYSILLYYTYKYRVQSLFASASATATVVACVCYGNMTGELGSTMPTFFMLGIYFKAAYLNSHTAARITIRKKQSPNLPSPMIKVPSIN